MGVSTWDPCSSFPPCAGFDACFIAVFFTGSLFQLSTVPDGASGATLTKGTCSRQSSTLILCSIGPGSGKNLVWRVVVGPDVFVSVAPLTLSFTPPVITGVSGAERMPTVGGSAVTITGTSFGPLPSIVVFYGPVRDPMRYKATNCTLLAMDTVLRCLRYVLALGHGSCSPCTCTSSKLRMPCIHLCTVPLASVACCSGASRPPTTLARCTL